VGAPGFFCSRESSSTKYASTKLSAGVSAAFAGFAKEELERKTWLESQVIAKYLFW
jgi:hypothetical protein